MTKRFAGTHRTKKAQPRPVVLDFEEMGDERYIDEMQRLIDSGDAWHLEGSIGRAAMRCIENGECVLGPTGHRDYYGNYVPSRTEVEPGTKGSQEYADEIQANR